MKKVIITSIPKCEQRYPTVGDYFYSDDDGSLLILVSEMKEERFEFLVAVHEYIEAMLCKFSGVTIDSIDKFDIGYERSRLSHGDEEPGFEPTAPYVKQHTIATSIEMMLCQELGISWKEYGDYTDKLMMSMQVTG